MTKIPTALLAAFAAPLLLASSAWASTQRTVSASGTCTRTATPDRGRIVITSEAQDKDLQVASNRAAEISDRATQAIKKLGLEKLELRTVEYQLGEVREWVKDREVSKGFKARIGLSVSSSSVERLGEVIAVAAREKVRDISSLATYLSPEKLRQESIACIEEAAADARAKASRLAASLGAKLGEAVLVSESNLAPGVQPLMEAPMMSMRSESKRAMAPMIEAGKQDIAMGVSAVFELR